METTRDISAEELAALRDPGARRGAFDRLVGAYLRPLYWHARRLVVVHEDAEDVVQETFVRAYDRIGTFRGGSDEMGAWLYRIARNLAVDSFRAEKGENVVSADDADYDVLNRRELAEDTIEDVMVDLQIEEDLRRLVDRLPDVQRQVLEMRYYQDLSFKEIAEITGVSINTALGRMRYAILNLRRMAKENRVCLTR